METDMDPITRLALEHLSTMFNPPSEEAVRDWADSTYDMYSSDRETLAKLLERWAKETGFSFKSDDVKLRANDIDVDADGDVYLQDMTFSLKARKGDEITLLGKTTTASDEVSLELLVASDDAEVESDTYRWVVTLQGVYENTHYDVSLDYGDKAALEILKDLEAALGDYVNSKTASTNADEGEGVQSLTSLSDVMFEIEQIGKQMRSARDERSVVDAIGQELMDLADSLKKNKFFERMPGISGDIGMNLRRLSETFDNIHGEGETEFLGDMVRTDTKSYREKAKDVLTLLEKIDKQLDAAMAASKKIS